MTQKNMAYTAVMKGDGWTLGIAERDKPGYSLTNYETVKTEKEAQGWADRANERMGVDKDTALDIITSSMRAQNLGARR